MIKYELTKEPIDLYIRHSVIIDLDTLEIIHQKLIQSKYNEIEYRFSVRNTNYICNEVWEVRKIFSDEGVTKINELDISCRNDEYKTITLRFKKSSTYYLHVNSLYAESNALIKEILAIIEEKNIHGYPFLTEIILKCENIAWGLLIVGLSLGSGISEMTDEGKRYITDFILATIIFFIFVIGFSSTQEVKIIHKKEISFSFKYLTTFRDILIGTTGSLLATLILS